MKLLTTGTRTLLTTVILSFSLTSAFASIIPMTLVSTGKPCFVSTGNKDALIDRNLTTNWDGAINSWLAIKVGSGYSKLLVHWIPAEFSNWIPYWEATDSTGAPGDYQILVSANSTNGQDGNWTAAVTVTGSHYVSRMHSFDFTGMQWVKMQITAQAWAKNPISLAEIEIFDASNGIEDTWFFMGNSITSGAFPNRITPSFSQVVTASHPAYTPAMINGGSSGARTSEGVSQINDRLDKNPDLKFWCLEYGTNDSRDGYDTAVFRANLDTMVTRIMRAGHTPMIARIPWNAWLGPGTPKYNKVIDDLTAKYSLLPGPDLFAWFQAHPEELKPQDIHPNDIGSASMNRLWAQAVSSLYSASTIAASPKPASRNQALTTRQSIVLTGDRLTVPQVSGANASHVDFYDVKGKLVGHSALAPDGSIRIDRRDISYLPVIMKAR